MLEHFRYKHKHIYYLGTFCPQGFMWRMPLDAPVTARWLLLSMESSIYVTDLIWFVTRPPYTCATVACIYRPPGVVSREFCDELADLLDQQQFVICGDFNCPGTDGHQLHASLVDVLQQYAPVRAACTSSMSRVATTHSTRRQRRAAGQVAVHSTCYSDCRLVISRLHVPCDIPSIKSYQYQDLPAFYDDMRRSPLYEFDVVMPVDDYHLHRHHHHHNDIISYHIMWTCTMARCTVYSTSMLHWQRAHGGSGATIAGAEHRWLSAAARDAKRRCRWAMDEESRLYFVTPARPMRSAGAPLLFVPRRAAALS